MKGSREKWRGEAEVSSLAPEKGNKADKTQGFSHHAQVLLPTPRSSRDQGREIHTHCTPRRTLAASERERAGTWRQRWWPKSGVVPVLKKSLKLSDMLGKGSLLFGGRGGGPTTAPPLQKGKEKTTSLVHQKPLGEFQETGLVSELRLQRTLSCTAAWSGLWTVAGEMSAKRPPTCVGVRAPWKASGGQLQD